MTQRIWIRIGTGAGGLLLGLGFAAMLQIWYVCLKWAWILSQPGDEFMKEPLPVFDVGGVPFSVIYFVCVPAGAVLLAVMKQRAKKNAERTTVAGGMPTAR